MAKLVGQKTKLIYILRILERFTDENHSITTAQIIDKLKELEVSADRKTLYSDISTLRELGYDIEQEPTRTGGGWRLISRDFELPELKLLVDAIQSSKFITGKKSRDLIKKLGSLTSKYDAAKLNRQVHVSGRIKSENESIFYIVDEIQSAIQENHPILFTYLVWNTRKELVSKGREKRVISPWALIWKDENYYLVGYDDEASQIKHFRVDKMSNVSILPDKRKGSKEFSKIDLTTYSDMTFGMMGGETEAVTFEFPERLVGVVIDRFGKDIAISKCSEGRFRVRTNVVVSGQLYGWLCGLGPECSIHAPDNVRDDYIKWLRSIIKHQSN